MRAALRLASLVLLSVAVSAAAPPPAAPPPQAAVAPGEPAGTGECDGTVQAAGVGTVMTGVFSRLRGVYRDALPGPDGVRLRDLAAERLAREHVDVETFTEEALRMAWPEADESHRARWRGALGALLHNRYLRALRDPLRFRLAVEAVRPVSCDRADVDALLTDRRTGGVTTVTLRLRHGAGVWRAWDVQFDDTSLVQAWRGRFLRIHRAGGIPELDRQLRKLAHRFKVEAVRP